MRDAEQPASNVSAATYTVNEDKDGLGVVSGMLALRQFRIEGAQTRRFPPRTATKIYCYDSPLRPCSDSFRKGKPLNSTENLKTSGLKATIPRLRILELFERAQIRHLSAEDVYKLLQREGTDTGLATVYRVLTQFEDRKSTRLNSSHT